MPKPALPGSPASASLIAYVMSQKFVFGIPLYRQEKQWEQLGVEISRQTMANWMIQSSERWFRPLYERMREYLLKRDIVRADKTTLQVLNEPRRPAESKSYMWLYRTGREGPPIILYDYQTTRASKHPERFLKGFKGYLCTDAYQGYNDLPGITNEFCWAHYPRCMIIQGSFFSNNPAPITIEMYLNISVVKGGSYELQDNTDASRLIH